MTGLTDEQVRKGAVAIRDHLLHCLQPLTLPADSHIERAFVLGVQAAASADGELARLKRALAEYPLKNQQQLQAHKVCVGVIKLAASYAETKP